MAKPTPAPISTSGHWRMPLGVAQSYLRIMMGMEPKGGRAIYLSRLKNCIAKQTEEISEKRMDIMREYAVLKDVTADGKSELVIDDKGEAQFPGPGEKKLCIEALEVLAEDVPVVVDFADSNMRKGAEHALKILEGDDCPPIPAGFDWAHERLVTELQLAFAEPKKAEASG